MQVGPRCCWFCPIAQFYGMCILILHHFCIIFAMGFLSDCHRTMRCTGAFWTALQQRSRRILGAFWAHFGRDGLRNAGRVAAATEAVTDDVKIEEEVRLLKRRDLNHRKKWSRNPQVLGSSWRFIAGKIIQWEIYINFMPCLSTGSEAKWFKFKNQSATPLTRETAWLSMVQSCGGLRHPNLVCLLGWSMYQLEPQLWWCMLFFHYQIISNSLKNLKIFLRKKNFFEDVHVFMVFLCPLNHDPHMRPFDVVAS